MHELTRRAYLDAMGIATYVSRAQVPGSAKTLKLTVVKHPDPRAAKPAMVESPGAPISAAIGNLAQMPSVDFETPQRTQSVVSEKLPAAGAGVAPTVEFGIVAFISGSWLWLEELPPQQVLMRDQVQLVQAMASAMVSAIGPDVGKPEVAQFHWPITTNNQLDLGEAAARGALGGFINRKLELAGCRGVVLLGSACERWIPVEQLTAEHRIHTVSTAEMLGDPSLKKRAWRDLLPYVS